MNEIRIYAVNLRELDEPYFEEEDFMKLAEEQGYIWTLQGFENEFNSGFMDTENLVMKFITIEL